MAQLAQRRRSTSRVQRSPWTRIKGLFIALVLSLLYIYTMRPGATTTGDSSATTSLVQHSLLAESPRGPLDHSYADVQLSLDQVRGGGFLLLIVGVLYMFLALAIVCDEFFVPALEVICDNLGIQPDVAGATFMAAGGSAPELFTSFMGVFVERSDVGFGTIVGSAVFNVLFVIAMCSLFSSGDLPLTWWPLLRDSVYYSISLVVLAIFFSTGSGDATNAIEWYEAAILFVMYTGYAYLMKNNERAYRWAKRLRARIAANNKVAATERVRADDDNTPKIPQTKIRPSHRNALSEHSLSLSAATAGRNIFRAGIVALMTGHTHHGAHESLTARSGRVRSGNESRISSLKESDEIRRTAASALQTPDGAIDHYDLGAVLTALTHEKWSNEDIASIMRTIDEGLVGYITLDDVVAWYRDSSIRVLVEMKRHIQENHPSQEVDPTQRDRVHVSRFADWYRTSGFDAFHARVNAATPTGPRESEREAAEAQHDARAKPEHAVHERDHGAVTNGVVSVPRAHADVEQQAAETEPRDTSDEDDEDDEPLDLSFPAGAKARIGYLVSAPLLFALAYTVPDVRAPKRKRFVWVAFLMCMVWLGVFSYFMVRWAAVLGEAFAVPPEVMGLTFLAAGTSVPDLISSVLVAKRGEGDMAVSSSIGSNIFDILVGLPLPWLCYTLAEGRPFIVTAVSLQLSVIVLLLMLILVIASIAMSGWVLSRKLGYAMLVLYVIFVAQDLFRALM